MKQIKTMQKEFGAGSWPMVSLAKTKQIRVNQSKSNQKRAGDLGNLRGGKNCRVSGWVREGPTIENLKIICAGSPRWGNERPGMQAENIQHSTPNIQ
jgi:hypothetical protein